MHQEDLMLPRNAPLFAVFLGSLALSVAGAEEPVDLDMVTRIRDEGFRRSQVMDTVRHLTDEIGPRITGSPAAKEANEWTLARLGEWGLENGHLESYEFGRGWSFERCSVHMISPRKAPLLALPAAWSPGTDGPVRGEAFRMKAEKVEDLEKYEGRLAGKIVFVDEARGYDPNRSINSKVFHRFDEDELSEVAEYEIPDGGPSPWRKEYRKRWELRRALNEMLVAEGAVALVEISSRDNGIVRVTGMPLLDPADPTGVTTLGMAAEHYNWILRLLESRGGDTGGPEDAEPADEEAAAKGPGGLEDPVVLEIDVRASFHEDDLNGYNTIAEIPGRKGNDEVVIAGAHLDAWHAGAGATDNAAGCAVVMEAARILEALGVEPRRTIRIALWTGEEVGFYGSQAYVREHFATRPEPTDPGQLKLPPVLRETLWPLTLKPDHAKVAGYFNYDNGSGKIRGIYAEENAGVVPIFEAWLEPFEDLGAGEVTSKKTGGTDHVPFDRVGLSGFQFIQDRLEYGTRTHHTNLDVYDHLQADDLKQSAVILASFLYHAAMRDEMLPRKPVPRKPPEEEKDARKKTPAAAGAASGR
jgi:hypothetical protein